LTIEEARRILDLIRNGQANFPRHLIDEALQATGDLPGDEE